MIKTLIMLFMGLSSLHVYAADSNNATIDGRLFQTLTSVDIETLSAPELAAYKTWDAARNAETSTYQQSEGPNTMDISSDFSM